MSELINKMNSYFGKEWFYCPKCKKFYFLTVLTCVTCPACGTVLSIWR